jgi:hypothetical protein
VKTMKNLQKSYKLAGLLPLILMVLTIVTRSTTYSGERLVIQMKDFTKMEVKTGGFTLPGELRLRIHALGAGVGHRGFTTGDNDLFAYGWIINAETREPVWEMTRSNTSTAKSDREFNGDVVLPAGNYEVYFCAYAFAANSPFSSFSINIDRRKGMPGTGKFERGGFFSWLYDFFGEDGDKEWTRRAKNWGIEIFAETGSGRDVPTFTSPKEFSNILYQSVKVGENEHITQTFSISKMMPVRIYAVGEMGSDHNPVDYGWILNTKTRERIWDMRPSNTDAAGGAEKNIKYDKVVDFPPGDYTLYYVSDDSHSFLDWNQAPPYDPYHYGITLIAASPNYEGSFKLQKTSEEQNVIAQLIRVKNNESRSQSFTLKGETKIRVYAIGERSNSRSLMADFGSIVNARTREKVWSMDEALTEHAGGSSKNRLVDEIVTLPKGTYTVNYQTDDSHAYNQWNSSPPFDPEHWGITVYLVDEKDRGLVEKNVTPKEEGVIAQIVRVGDDADRTEYFKLDKPTHVRIYALGEGQNSEMFDYGWIENASTGEQIWEMTYSMTFHAGGGRKNRIVNTTILLDKGKYKLRYVSDDSHSYNDWNADPPSDQTMWGITLYDAEHQ